MAICFTQKLIKCQIQIFIGNQICYKTGIWDLPLYDQNTGKPIIMNEYSGCPHSSNKFDAINESFK